MFFEQDGCVRNQLGDLWFELAPVLIGQFREDTAHRTEQRWFGKLLTTLRTLPDFEGIWNNAIPIEANESGWSHTSVDGGMVGAVRSQLSADPRLIVGHIVPEDPDGRTQMLKRGAFLG
jgi:hypothetical protein